jgi:hypothetical protein|tara:strand:- start:6618 stop:7400 length:783 start_codon:yes stop_codon:yes gene_type:complete
MNNKIKVSLIALACAAASACTSSPNDELIAKLNQMEKRQMEIKEAQDKKEQAKREAEIEAAPSWVLSPPQSDATGVYGVGIAESKKLSHGLKAAKLQAEFELAKMFKQELSGSERAYEQGDSDGEVTTQTTFLIDKLVDSVLVVGFEVVEQKIVPINGVNNVYVLLKMPYEQFNKVLQAEKAKTLDSKVQVAFDDLERRLEKRRVQKEDEKQAEFERKQEALKSRAEMLSGNDKKAKQAEANSYNRSESKKNTIEDIFLM